MRLALLVSGASGMELPLRFLQQAATDPRLERLHLVVSAGAAQVMRHELAVSRPSAEALAVAAKLPAAAAAKVAIHRDRALDAPISSGSYRLDGTVVLPCSASTLGALATGTATTLVHRGGAVALKERWPLVLGFRETPLSVIHLENLRRLAWAGAVILPPIPAFYVGEQPMTRFLDAYVQRVLDHVGMSPGDSEGLRWSGATGREIGDWRLEIEEEKRGEGGRTGRDVAREAASGDEVPGKSSAGDD